MRNNRRIKALDGTEEENEIYAVVEGEMETESKKYYFLVILIALFWKSH